jgi:tetratricopeptide (TPR) repeat protein
MDNAKKAIKFCLEGNWQKAVEYNSILIKEDPKDINALNRLARSWTNLGNLKKARFYYDQVLKIDKYNSIALKNIEKIKQKKKKTNQNGFLSLENAFIEEPGRTKTIKLLRLASPKTILSLDMGQKVNLIPKKKLISVVDEENNYLGIIPDDLSRHLIVLLKGGNEYESFVKSTDKKSLEIFIREIKKDKKFINKPSFPSGKNIPYNSYLDPEKVYEDTPDTSTTEDGEEES